MLGSMVNGLLRKQGSHHGNRCYPPLLQPTQFNIGSEGYSRSALPAEPTRRLKRLPVTNKPSVVPGRGYDATAVDRDAGNRFGPAIQGQLLRCSERREVAIYLRKDALWVADFIDGDGQLIDAITWFRFNCGTPFAPYARRRMILESAMPLSGQLAARIESLHRSSTVRKRGALARLVEAIVAYAPQSRLMRILRKRPGSRPARSGNPSL